MCAFVTGHASYVVRERKTLAMWWVQSSCFSLKRIWEKR